MPCGTHRHHRHSCRRHAGLCGVAASTSHVVGGGGLPAIARADLPTPPVSAFLSHQRSPCWPPAASDATRVAPASLCCQPSTAPASLGPSSRASYPLYPATINAGLPHRRARAMEGALGSGRRATDLAASAGYNRFGGVCRVAGDAHCTLLPATSYALPPSGHQNRHRPQPFPASIFTCHRHLRAGPI